MTPPVDLGDVQANTVTPLSPSMRHVVLLFLHVEQPARAAAWLSGLAGEVTSAKPMNGREPDTTLNVALTAPGLSALGAPGSIVESFADPFREGMAARAGMLGDTGPSSPSTWDAADTPEPHVLLSVYGRDEIDISVIEKDAADAGLLVVWREKGERPPDTREHFGFADARSQPSVAGLPGTAPGAVQWGHSPLGEFLHGYPDVDGDSSSVPAAPFDRNGCYLVYRKLAQDVGGFRSFTREQARLRGLDEELVAAKMVGRWRDGTPLVLSPDRPDPQIAIDPASNAFSYADDRDGFRCPVGAHIRRANPRDSIAFGEAIVSRHRMIRRGVPYGRRLPDGVYENDGEERGLLFMAVVADIRRQFEVMQAQWCNDGDVFGLGLDRDPLAPASDNGGTGKMTVNGDPPVFLYPLPAFVTTRGGGYFYVPGVQGLRALALFAS